MSLLSWRVKLTFLVLAKDFIPLPGICIGIFEIFDDGTNLLC